MYGDAIGFQAWLDANGLTLPVDAPAPLVLLNRGSAYLDATYEGLWSGRRTDIATQENAWPRTGALLNCREAIPSDIIPQTVITAAYRAAYIDATQPGVLSASSVSGARVKRQKVDVIEQEFFDDGAEKSTPGMGGPAFIDAQIDGAMRAFICEERGFILAAIGS